MTQATSGENMDYNDFLKTKRLIVSSCGKETSADAVHEKLFPFQRDLVVWALRKGRAAIFADTGLGKTLMQIEWARLIGEKTLIIAPLSVASQTIHEAQQIGVEITYSRDGKAEGQITITNYEMLHKFDASQFGAVVLDESSILKALDGKTRKQLTEMFAATPYRLCCTATPAPNDIAELGNHSEFLSVLNRVDMLATFFVHDANMKNADGWRIKGHAETAFYRWLASWGMSIRKPSDLGYDDAGYDLPPLTIEPVWVDFEFVPDGKLLNTGLKGITDRSKVRRGTMQARCEAIAEKVKADDQQWLLWVGLNDEGDLMQKLLPDAVQISGSQSAEEKTALIEAFQEGKHRILISKTSITGFGVNLQNCHQQAFVGLSDSWEQYYQAIRRSYRFGQKHPVQVYIALSNIEQSILDNIKAKESEALTMSQRLIENVQSFEQEELQGISEGWTYQTETVKSDRYTIMLGDSAERMKEIETDSVDLSIFSPPFMSLYAYSPTERDLGNSRGAEQFFKHFDFIIQELLRVTAPGRLACVHVAQVPATKLYDGYIGLKDFRGDVIRKFDALGWIYHGEICVDKDPQAQAIRTKAKSLLFVTLDKDSSWLRPAMADYVLLFRKPGDNQKPIKPLENGEMSREDWISWARPIWYDIKETETLNVVVAREDKDERHICPLQLPLIERCIKLWSNPDEVVFDPFGGLGSTGYEALRLGRRAVMCELKPAYFEQMKKNITIAAQEGNFQMTLFNTALVDVVDLAKEEQETREAEAVQYVAMVGPALVYVGSPEPALALVDQPVAPVSAADQSKRSVHLTEDIGGARIMTMGPRAHYENGISGTRYSCVHKVGSGRGGFKEIEKKFLETADQAEAWFESTVAKVRAETEASAGEGEKAA